MVEELSLLSQNDVNPWFEAWKAGHAAAMIANLHLAGNPERTTVWGVEEAAWSERRDRAIQNARLPNRAEYSYCCNPIKL